MEGEVVGGDEGEVGWPELALELLTEKERETPVDWFLERDKQDRERKKGKRRD